MTVYKDKERGTWYVTYRSTDPITGKTIQHRKRGFETKREAMRWELMEAEAVTKATFWQVFQEYLDHTDAKGSTRSKKEGWVKKHFPYKDTPIEDIAKSQLVKWRSDLRKGDLAVRTINNGLQYVRSTFAFNTTVYGGSDIGAVLKSFKVTKADKLCFEVWTIEEFNQFISKVDNPVYHAYFTFLFWSGCRRGEGVALTKDCFTGNRVHIYRSMKHYKHGFRPLKTDSSERTITLDQNLMDELQPFIDAADPFVFGGVHPLYIHGIDKAFKKALEESEVKKIRIHDLRHSHASILLNNGVNILAVSKRLGHATPRTTLDVYAHLMKDTEDGMMDIIADLKKK